MQSCPDLTQSCLDLTQSCLDLTQSCPDLVPNENEKQKMKNNKALRFFPTATVAFTGILYIMYLFASYAISTPMLLPLLLVRVRSHCPNITILCEENHKIINDACERFHIQNILILFRSRL